MEDAGALPLDIRVLVRFPRFSDAVLARTMRLPLGSELRRRLIKRAIARGFELLNRGEMDALLRFGYEPDFELNVVGFGPAFTERYHGWDGSRQFYGEFIEAFDPHYTVEDVIDMHDRLLVRVGIRSRGVSSGVETTATNGWIYHLSPRGKVARMAFVWTWDEAVASLGLAAAH
jgi:hypothetical protein